MSDFRGHIEVRPGTDAWGPYTLDLSAVLPAGQTIANAHLTPYSGELEAGDDTADFTVIPGLLEEGETLWEGGVILFKLQYPGEAYRGISCTLVAVVTTTDGGVRPFYFYPIVIR